MFIDYTKGGVCGPNKYVCKRKHAQSYSVLLLRIVQLKFQHKRENFLG